MKWLVNLYKRYMLGYKNHLREADFYKRGKKYIELDCCSSPLICLTDSMDWCENCETVFRSEAVTNG